jgi:hypothetical protein
VYICTYIRTYVHTYIRTYVHTINTKPRVSCICMICNLSSVGSNRTIVSYNASVVKIYSATNSIERFRNTINVNDFSLLLKRSSLRRWRCNWHWSSNVELRNQRPVFTNRLRSFVPGYETTLATSLGGG